MNVRTSRTQFADDCFVFQRGMGTAHQVQYAVRTALYRQMQETHQLRRIAIDINYIVGEFDRVAGGKTDAVNTVNGRHQTQQIRERTGASVVILTAPGVNVLAQQVNFTYALRRQLCDFKQDIVARAADFFATGIGHDAVSAVFITAFHDRDERGRPLGFRFRQTVEFLDLREADIHDRATVASHGVDHLRQTVQRLRSKNNVNIVGTLANMIAFLRCDATADTNDQVWIFFL